MNSFTKRVLVTLAVTLGFSSASLAQTSAPICNVPGKDGTAFVGNSYFPGTANSTSSAVTIGTTARVTPSGTAPSGSWAISQTAITAGDLIFIMQMQDATINTADSNLYGSGTAGNNGSGTTGLRESGKWEFAVVSGVSSGVLSLRDTLKNAYSAAAATATATRRSYQVVRVAQNSSLTLASDLSVVPWNGFTGGVIVFDVSGTLNLNGRTVNGDGAGFRGGGSFKTNDDNAPGSTAYITSTSNTVRDTETNSTGGHGGFKGEGVAGTPRIVRGTAVTAFNGIDSGLASGDQGYPGTNDRSRGAPANAGGGGTAHNSGGGGGGNAGLGGSGGNSFGFFSPDGVNIPGGFTCEPGTAVQFAPDFYTCSSNFGGAILYGDDSRPVGGRPGAAVTPSSPRAILGGGGGGGENNNGDDNPSIAQVSGGNGGGVILIRALTLTASTASTLRVNGEDGQPAGRDGGGGGGAGGTVALAVPATTATTINNITIQSRGGKGGNSGQPLRNGETQGTGGGGGGGAVLKPTNVTLGTAADISGGAAGTNTNTFTPSGGSLTTRTNAFGAGAGAGAIINLDYVPTTVANVAECFPQLTVTKTTSTGTRVQGVDTTASYEVTFSNAASTATIVRPSATGVTLTDTLAAPITFPTGGTATVTYTGGATGPVANNATLAPSSNTAQTVVFGSSSSTFTIPAGGSVKLTFTVNLNNAAPGTYNNSATASYVNPAGGPNLTATYDGPNAANTAENVVVIAPPTVAKAYNPVYIVPGQTSTLTITLRNPNTQVATLSSAFTDVLAIQLNISSPATTCGGTGAVTADNTTKTITLPAGRTIPAATGSTPGSCTITVSVTSSTAGVYNNVIAGDANAVTGDLKITVPSGGSRVVSNVNPANAQLVVLEPTKRVRIINDNGDGVASPGETLEYTIVYGVPAGATTPLTTFQMTDALPTGLTYVASSLAVSSSGTGAPAVTANTGYNGTGNNNLLASAVTLAAGQSITATLRATIGSSVTVGTNLDNQANASSNAAGFPPAGLPTDANAQTGDLGQPQDTPGAVEPTRVTVSATNNAGPPFACDAAFYQIRASGTPAYSRLFKINRPGFTQTSVTSLDTLSAVLNGLAYNPQDNFLYALYLGPNASNVTGTSATQGLYRIGQNSFDSLGNVTGLPNGFQATAADFDANGNYFVTEAGGSTRMYRINVSTLQATEITLSVNTGNLGDMSLSPVDGFLYGAVNETTYFKIQAPATGTTSTVTPITITGVTAGEGNWGTTYMDTLGNWYAYANNGFFYQLPTAGGAAIRIQGGLQTATRSDGAACAFPKQRLDTVKSLGTVTQVATNTFDVPFTVSLKNTGVPSAPNVQLTENLTRTFPGASLITVSAAPAITAGTCTANSSFNGAADTRLLLGNDTLASGATCTVTFTARVAYSSAPPTTAQQNTVYASSTSSANNPGYTFVPDAAGTPVPPGNLLAADLSTTGNTLPATPNGDTPAPTLITFPAASGITGTVYRDLNKDSTKATTEPGIQGVVVTLKDSAGNDIDSDPNTAGVQPTTAITNASGVYSFPNVVPGSYRVVETQPAGLGSSENPTNTVNVTVTAGANQTINFGEIAGSLAGTVYRDDNNDGNKQATEPGIQGVTVQLLDSAGAPVDTDPVTAGVQSTATTDASGNYTFLSVPGGTGYRVVETQPTGFLDGKETAGTAGGIIPTTTGNAAADNTITGINVPTPASTAANDPSNATGYLFGERGQTITGKVYRDLDKTSAQNGTDPGLAGVIITLKDSAGNDIDSDPATAGVQPTTAVTDGNGNYSFPNLSPGSYRVVETQPTGYGSSENSTNTANVTVPTTTAANGVVAGPNFGEITGSLAGTVYRDDNDSGTKQATEPGLGGVTLQLLDSAGAPVDTDPVTAGVQSTVVSNPDGTYLFPNVLAGNGYRVVETQPTAYSDGKETAGTAGGTIPTTTGNAAADNTITGINVVAPTSTAANDAANATGYLFGERGTNISGTVYRDLNKDGTKTANEPGVQGIVVTLKDSAGNDIDSDPSTAGVQPTTATTDVNGNYTFPNLPAGTYQVVETQPAGLGSSTPNAVPVTLVNGTPAVVNYGETAGSLAGTVYRDDNNDAAKAATEPGLAGVTLQLQDSSGNPVDTDPVTAGIQSAVTTGPDGSYVFNNVPGGNGYRIVETQPAAYSDGQETAGTAGGTVPSTTGTAAANNTISNINLPTPNGAANDPANATGYLFGERGTGISGTVYRDDNRNNTKDGTEPALPGVVVTLRDGAGVDIDSDPNTAGVQPTTATTDANGNYSFPNLPAGNYTVVETQPAGYGSSQNPTNSVPVTLVAGTPAVVNFGETLGSIAGRVFRDPNDNGTQDGGETGIQGVTLQVQDAISGNPVDTDPNTAGVQSTVTTDTNGNYIIPNLLAGAYRVIETQPSGFTDGKETAGTAGGSISITQSSAPADNTIGLTTAINLGAGQQATGYTFAELPLSGVTGVVYNDLDRDGTRDAGEPGLPGAIITLKDSAGNDIDSDPATAGVQPTTTTTGPDGSYSFPNVPAGNYQVVETQPTGYGSSTPNTVNVTLPAGGSATANFGDTLSTLAGTVFRDDNDDATKATAEPGIAGVTLQVQNAAGDPVDTDPTTPGVQDTVVTDASGNYKFNNLPAGTYTIVETQPAAFTDGKEKEGTFGGTVATTPGNNTIATITVPAGQDGTGYLFGERGTAINGTVYVDVDGDGTRDPGEAPVAGVIVTLKDSAGNDVDSDPNTVGVQPTTTTTAPDGSYSFPNLPAGNYQVVETQPNAYGTGTPNIVPVTLVAGTPGTANFGEDPATISGFVYNDLNDNGVKDAGESGVPNVKVTLTGTDINNQPVTREVTTGADGSYNFGDLPRGSYKIVETQPVGYPDGKDTVGTAGGNASVNDEISNIVLAAGQDSSGYLFGEKGAPITGKTFLDTNDNGTQDQDAGEPGLPGVVLTLKDAAGNDIDSDPVTAGVQPTTTTTGPDGSYSFPPQTPGDYQVVQTQPNAYETQTQTPNIKPIMVTPTGAIANFAEKPAQLKGAVFRDDNNNGVKDAGEPGIAGVTVTLAGNDINGLPVDLDPSTPGVQSTATTDADGNYTFNNIPASSPTGYNVVETQPAAFGDGKETPGTAGGTAPTTIGNDATSNTISGVVLDPGERTDGYLFGERGTGISGTVFRDDDQDGTRDPGEPSLPGVPVTLKDAAGNDIDSDPATAGVQPTTTTTGPDGSYSFPNLPAGNYQVVETQPAGLGSSTPNTVPVTVAPGAPAIVNFGETAASISGLVYNDLDKDGTQDAGEPGIAGVQLTLKDSTGADIDSDSATAGVQPTTVVTDADGKYNFKGLPAGTYTVVETQPAGFDDGAEKAGTAGGITSTNDQISGITLTQAQNATGYEFAETALGTVIGTVFRDDDGNGSQGANEPGIPGVQVTITNGGFTQTVTTGPDGKYELKDVPVGTVTVDIVDSTLPGGVTQTAGVDPSVVTLARGETKDAGADGYRAPAPLAVGDTANTPANTPITFPIATNDSVAPGSSIVPSSATFPPAGQPAGSTISPDGKTITVPGEGKYEIQPDGQVKFTPEPGFSGGTTPVKYTIEDDKGNVSNPAPIVVNVGAPNKGSVTGTVYRDDNGNGAQDAGEPGLPNVSVNVTDKNGVTQTVTTDANGKYTAVGIPAGTVTVDVVDGTLPEGYAPTNTTDPSNTTVIAGENSNAGNDGYRPKPPVATGDTATTPANTPVTLPILGNDAASNPYTLDSSSVTFPAVGQPSGATVTDAGKTLTIPGEGVYKINPDGTVTFTPDLGFSGSTTPVVYTVKDDKGQTSNPAPISVVVGSPTKGNVTGVVFQDTNGNGTQDPSEPGIPNVQVKVTNGSFTQTVTTDASGNYTAVGVPLGTATVDVVESTLPVGVTQTAGTDPSPVNVVAGQTADAGKDGYRPAPPVATNDSANTSVNTPVTLPGALNDTAVAPGTIIDPTTVDLDPNTPGDQKERIVPEGQYTANPDGSITFTPNPGVTGPVTPIEYTVRDTNGVTSNPAILSVTIGTPTTGNLTGTVFRDDNGNGAQDVGEPGLPNVEVTVTNGSFAQTVTTDVNGQYTAVGVPIGTATVNVVDSSLPAGYGLTTPGSDPSTAPVEAGQTANAGKDGYRPKPPVAVGDTATTAPDTNVTLPILGNDTVSSPNTLDKISVIFPTEGQPTGATVTDGGKTLTVPGEGVYRINPATGDVTFDPAPTFTGTTTPVFYTVKDDKGQVSNPAPITVTVGAPNKGNVEGVVFLDENGNGMQDVGEPGIPNVQVIVTNGTFTQTVTTDANGKYVAVGVPAGTATVDVVDGTLPAGVTQTAGTDSSTTTVVAGQTADAGKDGYRVVPPVANNDSASTPINTPITFADPITKNDTAAPGRNIDPKTVDLDPNTPGDQKELIVPGEGKYTVDPDGKLTFTPLPSFTGTTTPIPYTVRDDQGNTSSPGLITVNVGAPTKGDVTGIVFRDDNRDGTQQPSELGIAGVEVKVTDKNGVTQTVTTDANGKYTAVGVPAGTATVDVVESTLPAGVTQTAGTDPSPVIVVAGQIADAGKDGYGPKLPTANNDSRSTPKDTPVTIPVLSNDALGSSPIDPKTVDLDPSTPGVQTEKTVPEGKFTVDPNTGVVTFTPIPGFEGQVTPIQYTVKDEAGNTSNPATINVTVGPVGTINGVVFRDDNGNGIQEPTEPGLSGVKVNVTNTGGFDQTVTTDAQGRYSLPNVPVNKPATVDVVDSSLPTGAQLTTTGSDPTTIANVVPGNNDAGKDGYRLAPPKANDDERTTPINTPVTFTITGNDTSSNPYNIVPSTVDLDPATPGVQTEKTVPEGVFKVNGVGEVTFTPKQDFVGQVTPIPYTVFDSVGQKSNEGLIKVTVLPTSSDDTATTTQNEPVKINVVNNDKGVDPSTVKIATPPANGTAVVNADGTITYTPKPGFVGTDTFTYTACDKLGNCTTSKVTVTVKPTGTLTGTVFQDNDADGVRDPEDKGIPGVTVGLYELDVNGKPDPTKPINVDGKPVTAVTDKDGNYSFPNAPIGQVGVIVVAPPNQVLTTGNDKQAVTVPGKVADVGYVPAKIVLTLTPDVKVVTPGDNLPYTATVVNNTPNTPVKDPVLTIELPKGTVFDPNKPVVLDGKDIPKCDAAGTNVPCYSVAVNPSDPAQQILTVKLPELQPNVPQTIKYNTIVTPSVDPKKPLVSKGEVKGTASNGGTVSSVSSGAVAAAAVRIDLSVFSNNTTIVGRVYFDNNDDNNFNEGDAPLSGARVYLSDGRYAVTDANGRYNIPDVTPGVYAVRLDPVTAPYGVKRVPSDQGAPGTRYVRTADAGGIKNEDFLLSSPKAAAVKSRSTTVQRGPVTIVKSITQGGAGYAVTITVKIDKAVSSLSISDPLPNGEASRGPVTITGTSATPTVNGNVITIPGTLQPGTYIITYALFTPLPPDLALTDPDISYEEILLKMLPIIPFQVANEPEHSRAFGDEVIQ